MKSLDLYLDKPLRNLLLEFSPSLPVFEKYGIEFQRYGLKLLSDVLMEKKISTRDFLAEITVEEQNDEWPIPTFVGKSLQEIYKYIVEQHHIYVLKAINELQTTIRIVIEKYLKKIPELEKVELQLQEIFKGIKIHLSKEETIVFPLIKYLEDCEKFNERPHTRRFKRLIIYTDTMESDHHKADKEFKDLHRLLETIKYSIDKSPEFQSLITRLNDFEKNLRVHVHLEDNLLFPKANELENKLYKKSGGAR